MKSLTKATVDQTLGTPEASFDEYVYDGTLHVFYVDGKVDSIFTTYPNDMWITKSGVAIDTPVDEVKALYGDPYAIENNRWYYFFNNHDLCLEINADKVMSIFICRIASPAAT